MSASIETSRIDSDEDLFVPDQSYTSDEDNFKEPVINQSATSPSCSEEASSKENDKHSEDEKDGLTIASNDNSNQSEIKDLPAKKSKRKKAKRGKKSKTSGRRSPKQDTISKDADLDLLDALIAQNANLKTSPVADSTTTKTEPVKAAPNRKKKLAEIVREKREAAKDGLERKLDHAVKFAAKEPEKIKRFHEKREEKTVRHVENADGSKSTQVKVTREALQRFRNHLTTGVKGYAEIGEHEIPIESNPFSNHNSKAEYLLLLQILNRSIDESDLVALVNSC